MFLVALPGLEMPYPFGASEHSPFLVEVHNSGDQVFAGFVVFLFFSFIRTCKTKIELFQMATGHIFTEYLAGL